MSAAFQPPEEVHNMEPPGTSTAATLHDVALQAGVSLATASRALNGTRKVKEPYRIRVQAAAEQLGYVPNLFAQVVATGSTTTVALLVSDIADPYFSSVASGVIAAAEEAGLIVTIAVTGRDPQNELKVVRTLRKQRPRLMILAGSRNSASECENELRSELSAFRRTGGQVTFLSQEEASFSNVSIDNRAGGKLLAQALYGLGYRRFAVIAGGRGIRTSQDRLEGFLDGLASNGHTSDRTRIIHTSFNRDGGYHAANELAMCGLGTVELIFAVSDVMAIGAMSAIRDLGVVPGRGIAIAGYDDIPVSRDVTPTLTTVRIPLEEVGRRAVQGALDFAVRPGETRTSEVISPVMLRESTPPKRPTLVSDIEDFHSTASVPTHLHRPLADARG